MNTSILTNDWRVLPQNKKLLNIVASMKKISSQIEKRVFELDLDIISTRKDPHIIELWDKLCSLHRKALIYCRENPEQDPILLDYIERPQACITFLHLTEEETCCQRYINNNNFFKRNIQ